MWGRTEFWKSVAFFVAGLLVTTTVDAGAVMGKIRRDKENQSSRNIHFDNQSGRKVDVFWVNTFTSPEKYVPQFVENGKSIGLAYGADKSISSYSGHTFEIREQRSIHTEMCIFDECRSARVTVSDRQGQKVIINKDFSLTLIDERTKPFEAADDMFSKCQQQAADAGVQDPLESIDFITKCMAGQVQETVNADKEERSFHKKVHREMAADMIPFACGDVNQTQSFEIENKTWEYVDYGDDSPKTYSVRTMHQVPSSAIFVVHDFLSKATCDSLKIYRENDGVPASAAKEATKQGTLVKNLFYKIYDLLERIFPQWQELDFYGETLFRYHKDTEGLTTPSHICIGSDAVRDAAASIEKGETPACAIPGGDPVIVETDTLEVDQSVHEFGKVFLFCEEPKNQLGGIHFPYAGVHVTPEVGKLVIALQKQPGASEFDGYARDVHLCPNYDLYSHILSEKDSSVAPEGEL